MTGLDWFAILDVCEMGAVTDSLSTFPQDDLVPLEVATWRERMLTHRAGMDAVEVAARVAVQVIAAAIETDAAARLQLVLDICSRVKAEQ